MRQRASSGGDEIDPRIGGGLAVFRVSALRGTRSDKGVLTGRVIAEAMPGGAMPEVKGWSVASEPDENGLRTALDLQAVGNVRYLDAGGFRGRTLGLSQGAPAPAGR
jgi:hypothetical protein